MPQPLVDALADPLAFDDALAALRRYSLLEVTEDTLSVHRLVQAVARDRLPDETCHTWAEAALRLVNSVFPFESGDRAHLARVRAPAAPCPGCSGPRRGPSRSLRSYGAPFE